MYLLLWHRFPSSYLERKSIEFDFSRSVLGLVENMLFFYLILFPCDSYYYYVLVISLILRWSYGECLAPVSVILCDKTFQDHLLWHMSLIFVAMPIFGQLPVFPISYRNMVRNFNHITCSCLGHRFIFLGRKMTLSKWAQCSTEELKLVYPLIWSA